MPGTTLRIATSLRIAPFQATFFSLPRFDSRSWNVFGTGLRTATFSRVGCPAMDRQMRGMEQWQAERPVEFFQDHLSLSDCVDDRGNVMTGRGRV